MDTLGDMTIGPDGEPMTHAQVLRNVIDEGVPADEVGVDALVSASTIGPTSRCLLPRSGRGDRRAHETDPARLRR